MAALINTLSPRLIFVFYIFLALHHNRHLISFIILITPKAILSSFSLYILAVPVIQLYRQAKEMAFSGQNPRGFATQFQPAPIPEPGHFTITGNPPYPAPDGHTWVGVPPTRITPARWGLDPELTRNERGDFVTATGQICKSNLLRAEKDC